MVIFHNPIQNKRFNNLYYLSKQIYVGVIWKSDVNMPFVVLGYNSTYFSNKIQKGKTCYSEEQVIIS